MYLNIKDNICPNDPSRQTRVQCPDNHIKMIVRQTHHNYDIVSNAIDVARVNA